MASSGDGEGNEMKDYSEYLRSGSKKIIRSVYSAQDKFSPAAKYFLFSLWFFPPRWKNFLVGTLYLLIFFIDR